MIKLWQDLGPNSVGLYDLLLEIVKTHPASVLIAVMVFALCALVIFKVIPPLVEKLKCESRCQVLEAKVAVLEAKDKKNTHLRGQLKVLIQLMKDKGLPTIDLGEL